MFPRDFASYARVLLISFAFFCTWLAPLLNGITIYELIISKNKTIEDDILVTISNHEELLMLPWMQFAISLSVYILASLPFVQILCLPLDSRIAVRMTTLGFATVSFLIIFGVGRWNAQRLLSAEEFVSDNDAEPYLIGDSDSALWIILGIASVSTIDSY